MAAWTDLSTPSSFFPKVGTQINTTGGGGSGALVYAITSGGVITSLNIISGGTGYTANFSPTITGAGSGASVTLTVAGGAVTGSSSLVGGTGYVGTAPAWQLNIAANAWDTLITSIASLRAGINGNGQAISNLGSLALSSAFTSIKINDPSGTITAGGLWRLTSNGASNMLVLQINTAAGGNFSTVIPAMSFAGNGNIGIGTTAPTAPLQVIGVPVFANNAAAVSGGLTAGAFYRTGANPDPVCVVH